MKPNVKPILKFCNEIMIVANKVNNIPKKLLNISIKSPGIKYNNDQKISNIVNNPNKNSLFNNNSIFFHNLVIINSDIFHFDIFGKLFG